MSLCATCIWILDSELLSPCDDDEYFDDNGDYVREQSITVNSNEELDYLSTYWLFTPDQLGGPAGENVGGLGSRRSFGW